MSDSVYDQIAELLNTDPNQAHTLDIDQLRSVLKYAEEAYYGGKFESPFEDKVYDLINDIYQQRRPKPKVKLLPGPRPIPRIGAKPKPKPKPKPISQPTQKAPGPEPTNDGGGYISVPVPWYNDSAKKDVDTNNQSQGNSSNPSNSGANSKPSNNPPASQEQTSRVSVKPVAHKKTRARAVHTERVAIIQQKKKTPPWQKQLHTTAKKQPYGRSVVSAKKKTQRSVSSAPNWYVRAQIEAPTNTAVANKIPGGDNYATLPAPSHNASNSQNRKAELTAPTTSNSVNEILSKPSDTEQTSYNGKRAASLGSAIPVPTANQAKSASAIGIPAPNTHVVYQSMIPPPNRQ